jgi:protein-L-isoaspartate O-methyltransferase
LHSYGHGRNFLTNIPLDKIRDVMSAAEVAEKRAAGLVIDTLDGIGFLLLPEPTPDPDNVPAATAPLPQAEAVVSTAQQTGAAETAALRQTLAEGIKAVVVPQLFPTPRQLGDRVAELADVQPGQEFLEPNAGTGALVDAVLARQPLARPFMVEVDPRLAASLADKYTPAADAAQGLCRNVVEADFLLGWDRFGTFDRIVMNPPFGNAADIQHIKVAAGMIRPGGRLVALCANGPRQQAQLRPMASHWEELPAGAFRQQGTDVRTVLLVIER